jgi:hypothetical protein
MHKSMLKTKDESTQKESPAFRLDGVDDRLLQAFGRYHYLTAKQVTTLFYKPGTFTTVQARLKRLADNGFLLALALPTIRAKSPYVYTLATNGREYLTELGIDIPSSSYRPSKEHEKGYQFFNHTLAINDFLIASDLLTRVVPGVRIEEMLHDLTLKHDPPLLASKAVKGKKTALVPDGWLDFRVKREGKDTESRFCIWLELDRGTMDIRPLKTKVRELVALYEQGGYKARFGTNNVLFVFATTAGDRRVEFLRKWIREELHAVEDIKGKSWWFQMFAVCALPSELDPRDLFLGKVWYLARENTPQVNLLKLD